MFRGITVSRGCRVSLIVSPFSGSELIHGSFELQCEGIVFFLWDNSYDWTGTKQVSYKVEVLEVSDHCFSS
jgi:hypothetical protein